MLETQDVTAELDHLKMHYEGLKGLIARCEAVIREGSVQGQTKVVASVGRKSFHLETCEWGQKIARHNLIEFGNRGEAIANGFKPCRTCCA